MSVDTKHPQYSEFHGDWVLMQDVYSGERVVKSKGTTYLPATSGQIADGQGKSSNALGELAYQAYKTRAVFPSVGRDATEALLGIMHRKPPRVSLPTALEPLLKRATVTGESMSLLLRKINEQQLVSGRVGLMLDLPSAAPEGLPVLPYFALYEALTIINWDDGSRTMPTLQTLNLVVLCETENVRKDAFTWELEEKYRVLFLGDIVQNELTGVYNQTLFNKSGGTIEKTVVPSFRGKTLREIPFRFINSKDLVPQPDEPPLIGLATLALAIYRGEADFRQALFMQGQDTLVVIGGEEDRTYRVGSNATITPPLEGDAKFIGVNSSGLSEMRHALEDDKKLAALKGAQLIDTTSRQRESGDALRIRVAAQTATLTQIAEAGAEALEQLLKLAATWVGANPEEVSVEPNKDFTADEVLGKTLVEYMTAKAIGAPISLESIHELLKKRGLTDKSFEDEMALIAGERPLGTGTDAGQ